MQSLRNVTPEVQAYLDRKGRIAVAQPNQGGHSRAKLSPLMAEISGQKYEFMENPIKAGGFNGRDHLRQRSQKIKWTRGVRQAMASTLQHREHKKMLREGKVEVGAGMIEVPTLRTGTEG